MAAERFARLRNAFAGSPMSTDPNPLDLPGSDPPPPYTEVESSPPLDENRLGCHPNAMPRLALSGVQPSVLPLQGRESADSTPARGHHRPFQSFPKPPTRMPPKPPKHLKAPVTTGTAEPLIEDGLKVDGSRLPPSAKDLLGLEPSPINPRSRYMDSAALELELICTCCFCFESECDCPCGYATTVLPVSCMPWTKKPYGAFPVPEWLASTISMRAAHAAAGVANCFWPVMLLGAIPIFDQDSLVLVRSRALDPCLDAREFLLGLLGGMTRYETQECSCGCQEAICSRVALRHNLYTNPGALEQAQSTTYQIGEKGSITTAVTLGNGITCLSALNRALVDVNTDSVEDYVLISAMGSVKYGYTADGKWSSLISWDRVLNSWIITRLLWSQDVRAYNSYYSFSCDVTTMGFARYRNGYRFAIRSECFGTGTGIMVLDLPSKAINSERVQQPTEAFSALNGSHELFQLGARQKKGVYRDCTTAPPGRGWEELAIELDRTLYPEFVHPSLHRKAGFGYSTRIGAHVRPRPGFGCTMHCKNGVRAYCCGFTIPSSDRNDITVYVIGVNHSVAFLAIAEFAQVMRKPLYLVGQKSCLGCTVLQATPGSIVAGILPGVTLTGWHSEKKGA